MTPVAIAKARVAIAKIGVDIAKTRVEIAMPGLSGRIHNT